MKIFSLIFITISLFILPLIACKKGSYGTSDFLECRVNGKKWSAYSGDFKNSATRSIIQNTGQTVSITGLNSDSHEDISIGVFTPGEQIKEGIYKLYNGAGHDGSYRQQTQGKYFSTSETYNGELNITSIDTGKSIISGTFHFKAIDENSNESVEITNGSFRVHYQNQ